MLDLSSIIHEICYTISNTNEKEDKQMAFYKRIKDLREDSDKTQKEIADYLGTCYQYYAVYEKGKSEISLNVR